MQDVVCDRATKAKKHPNILDPDAFVELSQAAAGQLDFAIVKTNHIKTTIQNNRIKK